MLATRACLDQGIKALLLLASNAVILFLSFMACVSMLDRPMVATSAAAKQSSAVS